MANPKDLAPDADEPGDDLPAELAQYVTDHEKDDVVPDHADKSDPEDQVA